MIRTKTRILILTPAAILISQIVGGIRGGW
jgi:hypothetical protein